MNSLTKPQIFTSEARYAFGQEHNAEVELLCNEDRSSDEKSGDQKGCEQWRAAEAVDVSKSHLCVLTQPCESLVEDAVCRDIVLRLNEQTFSLKNLRVSKVSLTQDGRQQRIVFSNDDLEAEAGQENARQLWQISYALRLLPVKRETQRYDEFNLPKVPARGLYTEEARQERLAFARETTGAPLAEVEHTRFDPKALVSNIEALIGSVEIPVGIAGPLQILGDHANGLFYAPMATSEGALVASATRGATAISRSGGVRVKVLGQRMLRVPVFVLSDLSSALFFAEWVKDHQQEIAAQTRKYSNYANLVEVHAELMGRSVHVQFVYETGDAAGQNMTTTCTWQACQWILAQMKSFDGIEFENFLIEANLSNDKKVTYNSYLRGRGVRVLAETLLTDEVCQRVLKVSARQLFTAYNQFVGGSIAAGMVGININIANTIGAMFTATGQDIACVHESAIGQLHMELTEDGDVYATLRLPSLVVGTVGGGTSLPQQKECLELIGCAGPGCAHKLAEVIASFCLALDISTLSAIASDQFARAHEKLGRNRPVEWLKLGDLNEDFFAQALSASGEYRAPVKELQPLNLSSKGSSIITELTAHKINKLVGHFPFRVVTGEDGEAQGESHDMMVKVKPLDDEVILMLNSMASMCDARLAHAYNEFKDHLGFKQCHRRELAVMSQQDERFTRFAPKTYRAWEDSSREAYVIVQEYLDGLELMDSADDTSGWTIDHYNAAVDGIAQVHSIWYGREQELQEFDWLVDAPTTPSMTEKMRLWEMLGAHAQQEFPEWFSADDMERYRDRIYSLESWYPKLDSMKKTLTHNDFNPRNIAFRRDNNNQLTLCAYDWELATMQLPQHDLAELLAFALAPDFDPQQVETLIERHREQLQAATHESIDADEWRMGFTLSLWDLAVCRLPMYVMAHTFRHYPFMERVVMTSRRLLDNERIRFEALGLTNKDTNNVEQAHD
ncbi:phosphotransferase [Bacterioplanoides sp. SCSIO 12839]|uniref:phosphotransferase n=1 Tax=Bacterioplanoides sp. SCSIO 12839 TaxID=2829569 RepID=UPI002102BAEA|nr:phosphotransferase [Bacterioplanoides sp. SCSIO 12839]UTW49358.1 phosphotransferase [Bacterioplanoides sp. SCSIO 12839]